MMVQLEICEEELGGTKGSLLEQVTSPIALHTSPLSVPQFSSVLDLCWDRAYF